MWDQVSGNQILRHLSNQKTNSREGLRLKKKKGKKAGGKGKLRAVGLVTLKEVCK